MILSTEVRLVFFFSLYLLVLRPQHVRYSMLFYWLFRLFENLLVFCVFPFFAIVHVIGWMVGNWIY